MRFVTRAAIVLFWIVVLAFLHYTLPQNDVVRITDTYERRQDFGGINRFFWTRADGSTAATQNRDVFFIQSRRDGGAVRVYRNEDTGWGWPPYFKFDSSNVQAVASDLSSTAADPTWVAVSHYGWRLEFLSIYPNALSVRAVEGPDVRIWPWRAIITLIVLAAIFWAIWVRWRRFRQARIDPVLDDWSEGFDAAGDRFGRRRRKLRDWFRGTGR
ncbi:Protein of unknown function [Roseivivax marinus]|uniref:DUF1523 family protein n=1 Tax=Roseivivax marinus TaxID=1379903 RepID=UPI0008D179C9|nr:DUF1523 family protein [Roseivivax marinus]SEL52170.1 Protein of unknown function [Roseivivax marinus]